MRLLMTTAKILVMLSVCAAVTLFFYFRQIIYTPRQLSGDTFVLIKNGDSLTNIAAALKQQNLIDKTWHFIIFSKVNKIYPKIKAGEYLLQGNISLYDIAQMLTSGKVYQRKITFAEGLNVREIGEILYANEYLEGDFTLPKEGYFLPETYMFSRGDTRQKIIDRGNKEMLALLQKIWDERDRNLPLHSQEELLVLASIIEKETGVSSERPQISSVFMNRLRQNMLLQTDPTVIYAITKGQKDLGRPLNRKDLAFDSPYNTYKYAGLPPEPICNPGRASLEAAAHPDQTPYLYFVASGTGGHNFARTLTEHNQNVQRWKKLSK